MKDDQSKPNVWKGALAGLVAGLVASWTMNRFQDVWSAISTANNSMTEESAFDSEQLNTVEFELSKTPGKRVESASPITE